MNNYTLTNIIVKRKSGAKRKAQEEKEGCAQGIVLFLKFFGLHLSFKKGCKAERPQHGIQRCGARAKQRETK
ncbi:MAG: hypothetical protein IIZ39_11705 [Blautia sp.]|nr:hypothetical protein [Blautia sp.]